MLYTVMKHIRNFFLTGKGFEGTITIEDGNISFPFLVDGCYFLIEGSLLNDGVYKFPAILKDETFSGSIKLLNPPLEFLNVVESIETFEKNNAYSPYTSESFGGYSYTKATNSNGVAVDWADTFRNKLNAWRKV